MAEVYGQPVTDVLKALQVSADQGLSGTEVRRRRRVHGWNRLREARRKSGWIILKNQFESIIVWLLAAAALLSFYLGDWTEGAAIVAVLVINGFIGFTTELKAVRSMESLRRMAEVRTRVRRESKTVEIPAAEIVPGDIVLLDSGDVVTADLRLIETTNLECDESTLTGESVPVSKSTEPVGPDSPLADRTSMLFKGTAITRGLGVGVATATGAETELGHIAELAESAEAQMSPLEKRLDRLGSQLVWITLAIMPLVFVSGLWAGKDALIMIKTAVALAVAAIPEGLPIVATVALARGMWRMARQNALIERLDAVETLGATTLILTDKTGTLTENRMTVVELLLPDGAVQLSREGGFRMEDRSIEPLKHAGLHEALSVAVLCNDASLGDDSRSELRKGDPMELALLEAGRRAGLEREHLRSTFPIECEEAFSAETKMMATSHRSGDAYRVAVKGAPEAVLDACSRIYRTGVAHPLTPEARERWQDEIERMAEKGLRVLGLATKETASLAEPCYEDLALLGLVGLVDPPRADVAEALQACRTAGVRVAMLTGDHAVTARKIAEELQLDGEGPMPAVEGRELEALDNLSESERAQILRASVFARISPETKLKLVSMYQTSGEVVAMTGDGVNDAPALKKADIGIAMGQRGTQVAREAADMVLRDDAFPSIVVAMFQGRVIFENIKKFVTYLMSCNVSEILVIVIATLSGLPLPLLPLQILFLNLVTDVFPAFALGVGPGDPSIMRRGPRDPSQPILGREHWIAVAGYAGLITGATLAAFTIALIQLDMAEELAVTVAFLTLAFAQMFHVFNMREKHTNLLRNAVTRNPFVWAAIVLCAVLVVGAVRIPYAAAVLSFSDPGRQGWTLALGLSLLPLLLGQGLRLIRSR